MPPPLQLTLTDAQQHELTDLRDHHPKAYIRERAAAILKVADGWPVSHVAAYGLLKRHREETVSHWLDRYQALGLAGLRIRKGRGRRPAFSPLGAL